MYLTFNQAMKMIKPEGAKNNNYHLTRIRQLINDGHLEQANPEIFIKSDDKFISLGKIKTEGLVTEKSVLAYVNKRNNFYDNLGKIPKPNKGIKAVFADDSVMNFISIDSACLYFNISRSKIMRSIKKLKSVEVSIKEERKNNVDSNWNITKESVKFFKI